MVSLPALAGIFGLTGPAPGLKATARAVGESVLWLDLVAARAVVVVAVCDGYS
jgi:hypothetical protein